MSLSTHFTRPFAPLFESLRGYSGDRLRGDLMAGLTGSVLAIPQAMAYALIAGVDPIYGLYGAVIQTVIAAALSSSNYLAVGPTNAISLLTASVIARLTGMDGPEYLTAAAALSLLAGLIQLAFAAARLGNLTRYVSSPVIIGFTAGAGTLIVAKQIPNFLGVPGSRLSDQLPGLVGIIQQTAPRLGDTDWRAVAAGSVGLVVMIGATKFSRKLPAALLSVVSASALVAVMGWSDGDLRRVGALPVEFPVLSVPLLSWGQWQAIIGGALAVALLSMLESVSIAKSLAHRTGERIDANREFVALGAANVLSSAAGCFPAAGSFTRSALNRVAGGRTRLANGFNSMFVVVIIVLVAPLGEYLPLAALAAMLFVIGFSLVDYRAILHMARSSRSDLVVCLATFSAALLTHLEYAIFIGVFLNLGMYIRHAGRLHLAEMVPAQGSTPFIERPLSGQHGGSQVMFLQMEGDLFFGVADDLQDELFRLIHKGTRIIILRLKRTHSMDASILGVLERVHKALRERDGQLLICGVRAEVLEKIERYGLSAKIGQENIFPASSGVFNSAKLAIARAKVLAAHSLNLDDADFEGSAWHYEI